MRYTLALLIITYSFLYGQPKEKEMKGTPSTLEETFMYLNNIFDDTSKYNFMLFPEDVATGRLHMGLGRSIRNNWGLWNNSNLKHYFINKGISHPDDMSDVILTSYHRYLNNKPIDLEGQIEKINRIYSNVVVENNNIIFPPETFEGKTTDSALLQLFPIGDTVLVKIWATKKRWVVFDKLFNSTMQTVDGCGIIKGHTKDKLLIELFSVSNKPKYLAEKNAGDTYEESPRYANLLPPSNWTSDK